MNSCEWSARATAWATQHMLGAREQGLEVELMPPHLTLLAIENDVIVMEEPQMIGGDHPALWGLRTQMWLQQSPKYHGFLLWCIVGDVEGHDRACVVTWKKGDPHPLCVLMPLDFNPESFEVIDVCEVLEGFNIDFNQPPLTH